VGTSAIYKVIMKKIEKHERIKSIATAKLSSVNGLVSNALKDNQISDEEYKLILQEEVNYRDHKNQIRRRVRTEIKEMDEQLKEQIRQEAEKRE
jgi:phage-related minor tail protein